MIFDSLQNLQKYKGISTALDEGIEALRNLMEQKEIPDGRVEISDRVYINVMTYDTKPESDALFETHSLYADIQAPLTGGERFFTAAPAGLNMTIPYDSEKDIAFYQGKAQTEAQLLAGTFALVLPEDAHMPGVCLSTPEQTRKAVVKIKLR